MRYDGVDIMFGFFFEPGYDIENISREMALRLEIESSAAGNSDCRLRVSSGQQTDARLLLDVESSVSVAADAVFDVQAYSVSDLVAGVTGSGLSDSALRLETVAAGMEWDNQVLLRIGEEEWFTN